MPYGLITAELGSGWPEEGGIYVWVREAYGPRWGTFTAWLYWVNVAYWAPAVFVMFAGTLSAAFWGGMSHTWAEIIVIALIWLVVLIGILPMSLQQVGEQRQRRASRSRVLVMLGAMGLAFAVHHGLANSFARRPMEAVVRRQLELPADHHLQLHGLRAHELGGRRRASNPRRDIPRMLLLAGADHRRAPSSSATSASSPPSRSRTSRSSPAWPTP